MTWLDTLKQLAIRLKLLPPSRQTDEVLSSKSVFKLLPPPHQTGEAPPKGVSTIADATNYNFATKHLAIPGFSSSQRILVDERGIVLGIMHWARRDAGGIRFTMLGAQPLVEDIDGPGGHLSMCLNSKKEPVIAGLQLKSNEIFVSTRSGGTWQTRALVALAQSDTAGWTQIACLENGNLLISFCEVQIRGSQETARLRLLLVGPNGILNETVIAENAGFFNRMTIGEDGDIYFCHLDYSGARVMGEARVQIKTIVNGVMEGHPVLLSRYNLNTPTVPATQQVIGSTHNKHSPDVRYHNGTLYAVFNSFAEGKSTIHLYQRGKDGEKTVSIGFFDRLAKYVSIGFLGDQLCVYVFIVDIANDMKIRWTQANLLLQEQDRWVIYRAERSFYGNFAAMKYSNLTSIVEDPQNNALLLSFLVTMPDNQTRCTLIRVTRSDSAKTAPPLPDPP